ncbi:unnamed protein product [Prunus brigantina]
MNGLVRGATASLSRRFDVYEPLDRVMRSASRRDVRRRRSMSFKRKKVAHVPLRNNEDRAKQKRQIFLNSYKFESPKKSQRSRCMKLNKVARKVKTVVAKLVSSFFRIGVVIIAAVVISFIVINPHVPEYKINDFSVKAFNLTPDFNLNAHFVITVKAENPNKQISIIYGKGSSVTLLYSGKTLCSGKVPDFTQPTKNTTMINVDLKGDLKGSDFGGSLGESLMEKMKTDKIPLTVAVRVPVNAAMGNMHVLKDPMGIYVNCSMVVNNLSQPDKKVGISDTKYDVDFSYKFKH